MTDTPSRRAFVTGLMVSAAVMGMSNADAVAEIKRVTGGITPGKILHVRAGSKTWDPTAEELQHLVNLFTNAASNTGGSVLATRHDVVVDVIDLTHTEHDGDDA